MGHGKVSKERGGGFIYFCIPYMDVFQSSKCIQNVLQYCKIFFHYYTPVKENCVWFL